MKKSIIYKKCDGSLEVLHPCVSRNHNESDQEYFGRVSESVYPGREYSVCSIPQFPKSSPHSFDGIFRTAWTIVDGNIVIDIDKAKSIWMEKIRVARNKALKNLDLDVLIALEQGNFEESKEIGEIKQILRDLPNNIDFESVTTLDSLIQVWPNILPKE